MYTPIGGGKPRTIGKLSQVNGGKMKKLITAALILLLGASVALAGPTVGLQLEPQVGSKANFLVGWDFGLYQLNLIKEDFASWTGNWSIDTLWTPHDEAFRYHAGFSATFRWNTAGLTYRGLGFVIGAEKRFTNGFGIYAEARITSTGIFTPLLGANFYFDFLPPAHDESP